MCTLIIKYDSNVFVDFVKLLKLNIFTVLTIQKIFL